MLFQETTMLVERITKGLAWIMKNQERILPLTTDLIELCVHASSSQVLLLVTLLVVC